MIPVDPEVEVEVEAGFACLTSRYPEVLLYTLPSSGTGPGAGSLKKTKRTDSTMVNRKGNFEPLMKGVNTHLNLIIRLYFQMAREAYEPTNNRFSWQSRFTSSASSNLMETQ